ncbi:MAG: universal stress protein, partial [Alphaproteobacteria bacterium]|nr:universal stress protein [Alphaproteobacteria bacterium]
MVDPKDSSRPEPEALLSEVSKEGRGKLKIFMGAAPGVGKTFAMLEAAHRRKADGRDVVVGVVETHGRKETETLVQGLEVIPRRLLNYRGKAFQEMDLDALLRRKPDIALVDELAHTNVEGSRHAKRWQDVEELLAAGINVYSTLNIQHLESLNDIVQRITWVKIREKVPDSVLKMADEIALIDLPPEELIQRLREGKVYMPDQAQMAIRHYFSKGNLTALRELAMRTAAEHVDSDMIGYMKTHGVSGPWPARDRMIVCIDENSNADDLVRIASRMSGKDQTPWIALHVESMTDVLFSDKQRDNIDGALRLADELGGEAVTIRGGANIADDIIAFTRSRNATRILIGRSNRSDISDMLFPSVSRQLVIKAKDFD